MAAGLKLISSTGMKAESKKKTSPPTEFNIRAPREVRHVYYQNEATAALLSHPSSSWKARPLPNAFPKGKTYPGVVVGERATVFSPELREAIEDNVVRLVYVIREGKTLPPQATDIPIFSLVVPPLKAATLRSLVQAAFENLILAHGQAALEQELQRACAEIDQLNQIGIALSTQRDSRSLLNMILQKSRDITNSDAGSLYLVEENDQKEKQLRFKITQNDSLQVPFNEITLPMDASSIAGYVALSGEELHLEDVYQVRPFLPFRFNSRFDQESGYRTKSMLVMPMKNPQGEIIGVVQLINCKREAQQRVDSQTVDRVVVPFPMGRRALLRSLASQAAVAIENNRLYESIETLFEGFVKASVTAIESRDPTTSGHSFRVAELTIGLAQAVDRDDSLAFRDIRFSRSEMKEIRYASLLHDFGKVGVREEILVKAKKLYPLQLDLVKQRFAWARKVLEQELSERRLTYLLEQGREPFLAQQREFRRELAIKLRELDEFLELILKCNEPTVVREGNFQRLTELAKKEFLDANGEAYFLLQPEEVELLSISKGNLNESERRQIESHVIHTIEFLNQIPWTKEIRNIPAIAAAHHEKLTGSGYPNQLIAGQIPFQSKMMAIADIYDALSAGDRPYKKAVPPDGALGIIAEEVKTGFLDAELFRLFCEAQVFRLTHNWKHP
ncbi:MAG TPA: HD domain-containing phosphohydrolase [Candidatus Acidoferrales bacterium]|nr:HD domain-containing phosphohydrolase [Candidatus Acidoferrales bacterium]